MSKSSNISVPLLQSMENYTGWHTHINTVLLMKDLMHICDDSQLIKKELLDFMKENESIFSEPPTAPTVASPTLKILPFSAPIKGEPYKDEVSNKGKKKEKTEKESTPSNTTSAGASLLNSIIHVTLYPNTSSGSALFNPYTALVPLQHVVYHLHLTNNTLGEQLGIKDGQLLSRHLKALGIICQMLLLPMTSSTDPTIRPVFSNSLCN